MSHHRFGNVDWKLTLQLGLPGALGAFAGATFLSRLSTESATPIMAVILLLLGAHLLWRFAPTAGRRHVLKPGRLHPGFLTPLGLFGGFIDATGGGGWGPVSTTSLLVAGKTKPRTVAGSVDTAEFLVTAFASLGFLLGLDTAGINAGFVVALLVGGVVGAPVAAFLVSRLPAAILGTAAGGLVVLTNLRTLLASAQVPVTALAWMLAGVTVVVVAQVWRAAHKHRRARRAELALAAT